MFTNVYASVKLNSEAYLKLKSAGRIKLVLILCGL
jgi:hypothetical protein